MAQSHRRTDRTSSAAAAPSGTEGGREKDFPPAYKSARATAIFLVAAAAGAAADLLSKHYVFSSLTDRSVTVIDGLLKFTLSTNEGIVFGLPAPGWIVLAATLAATAAVIALFATSPSRRWGMHMALAMILAGAVGNAYDRVYLGHVRDFIDVYVGRHHWPTFNVADIFLVVGVGLILLETLRRRH